MPAQVQHRLEEMQQRLTHQREELSRRAMQLAQEVQPLILQEVQPLILQEVQPLLLEEELAASVPEDDELHIVTSLDEGASWLGVETREIDADKAKELKLPAERGVLLSRVIPESPAAKAGLKDNDVVSEINGQRVEGALQFRRMIREIPAGRTAQLNIWRDGRQQSISVTLGRPEERHKAGAKSFPSNRFMFRMPEIPELPSFEWDGELLYNRRARLGIDAEDLSGQLGAYFGAPDGEGILVRDVNAGSPADRAGIKAGDVLLTFNGERIRTVGDLREKLAAQREEKTVKVGLLRNHSALSLDVKIEPPAKPSKLGRRTNI